MPTTILERERRKLEWLRMKTAEQERWVRELERRERDPLDDLFDREHPEAFEYAEALTVHPGAGSEPTSAPVGSEERAPAQSGVQTPAFDPSASWGGWQKPLKSLPASWRMIFRFLGADGRSSAEVRKYIEDHGLLSWDTVRAGLMIYRRDYGLIESHKRGHYNLTQKGLDALTATKDESPAVVGEASESQASTGDVAQLV